MKKADYMIVGIALMLALVSFGVYRLYFASTGRAAIVEITVDGNVYKTLSLKEDATVDVPSDVRHVNLFQAIKKISKTVLNIKTGNYYTNLGGWWKKLVPT